MTVHLTDEQRAERRAAEREQMRAAIEQLRTSDGWQAWLRTRAAFRAYSLSNQLLIAHQRADASHVAGFRAWLKLGYTVRRGEHALRIWAPCPPSNRRLQEWKDAGDDPDQRPRTYFKLVAVFDVAQVDPLPPPAEPAPLSPPIEPLTGDAVADRIPALDQLAADIGVTVTVHDTRPADGSYTHRQRSIRIGEHLEPSGAAAVRIHELGHALVRLDRTDGDPQLDYASEEIVVEFIAHAVCNTLGLDTSANSVPYLAAWAEDADLDVLERTASLIDRLATRIENAVVSRDGDDRAG